MGNLSSDGMIDRSKITKICEDCHCEFKGWSENAKSIKGKMPPQPYCKLCDNVRTEAYAKTIDWSSMERSMKNQK